MGSFRYAPILKAKQGEKIALRHVPAAQWPHMQPIIEVLRAHGEVKPHVDSLAKDLKKANGDQWPFAIDTRYLSSKGNPAKNVAAVCAYLSKQGLEVCPVIAADMVSGLAAEMSKLSQYASIILRIPIGATSATQIQGLISAISKEFPKPKPSIHLVLDFEAIVGAEPKALEAWADPYVKEALSAPGPESVTIAGGSFPYNLVGFAQGAHFLPRVEWQAWQLLRKKYPDVLFGDYAVTNPAPLEDLDPTQINPSAAIRYALSGRWMLLKGGGTRTSGFAQYNQLCKLLVASPHYSGPTFSYGDERYQYHAQSGSKSGNLSSWRCDATSHHLAFTARECASLFGVSI